MHQPSLLDDPAAAQSASWRDTTSLDRIPAPADLAASPPVPPATDLWPHLLELLAKGS
jgi:hypothetical protein